MKELIFVFCGGGLGSCARYGLSIWLNPCWPRLPLGTLAANVLACLLLGAAAVALGERTDSIWGRLLLVGFCGGFSTFSTFAAELLKLGQGEVPASAVFYAILSLLLGLSALLLGGWLGKMLG